MFVGRFLGNNEEFNIQVLREYLKTFDFSRVNIDMALREFLDSFDLPKESQIIDRIIAEFGARFFEQKSGTGSTFYANPDACHVLAFSIIMLNTDLYNANVKKKITLEDYMKMVRGVNGGADFPSEITTAIFDSISQHEIMWNTAAESNHLSIMTEARWWTLTHCSDFLRQEFIDPTLLSSETKPNESSSNLILSSSTLSSSSSSSSSPLTSLALILSLEQETFSMSIRAIVSAFSGIFECSNDENLLGYTLAGFRNCATVAAFFKSSVVLDSIVASLCRFTELTKDSLLSRQASGQRSIANDKRRTLAFGRNSKAQLATLMMFSIAREHADHLKEGWKNVLECIVSLNEMDVLQDLFEDNNHTFGESGSNGGSGSGNHSSKRQAKAANSKKTNSNSILSVFGGWFGGSGLSEPHFDPVSVEAENNTREIAKKCDIKNLIESVK